MTPELRDRVALAIAPQVFAFTDSPLTPKGIESVREHGFKFFSDKEIAQLRLIAWAAWDELNKPQESGSSGAPVARSRQPNQD